MIDATESAEGTPVIPTHTNPMDVDSTMNRTWPADYKSAGAIPYNKKGFWLGKFEKGYADFGGKRLIPGRTSVVSEDNPWTTAQRELREESGLEASGFHYWTFHPDSKSKHVTFYVESSGEAGVNEPDKMTGVRLVTWTEFRDCGLPVDLHPRLKYDKGGLIRSAIKSLARSYLGPEKRQTYEGLVDGGRAAKTKKLLLNKGEEVGEEEETVEETSHTTEQFVGVDTKHIVGHVSRPVVVEYREDVVMRMAYFLSQLSCEEYLNLNPKRKEKCEKKGRGFEKEFGQLQGYLNQILGKENFKRGYAYATGKGDDKLGRLFSIGYGLQGVWSEVRGILARHMTDADMSNCHPRLLSWICDWNGIQNDEVKHFIDDREAIYSFILTSRWEMSHSGPVTQTFIDENRSNAKDSVLAMMNDQEPFPGIKKLPMEVQRLDAEFKRLQKEVCALPQYAHLERLSKTHKVKIKHDGSVYEKQNKLGSWLNLILCDHEKTFTNEGSKYLYEKHGLETGQLAFDGFQVYGDHYHREEELCGEMESMLKEKYKIRMPWAFKPQSTAIKVPSDFQVYDIPQQSYIQNISDSYLRNEADFSRMISGLRGEYDMSGNDRRGAYRAAAESLTIRSKRSLDSFSLYWDNPALGLSAEVLKYYSRESNGEVHLFNAKTKLGNSADAAGVPRPALPGAAGDGSLNGAFTPPATPRAAAARAFADGVPPRVSPSSSPFSPASSGAVS